jgi:plastocyanin
MFASRLSGAMLLSIASLAPAAPRPAAQTIYLASFNFSPKPIRLTAGRPVTLTFVNRSGSGHDFTAKTFFANSTITAGSAPGGEIELDPHETKRITLIPRTGTYKAHCSHFLHKQLGMVDEVVVS